MLSDIKYTIRSLLKSPGFTVIAILTLALGIGATTAIFSVVNAVLLKPLPYVQPGQLARICAEFPSYPNGGIKRFSVDPSEYNYFRRELKSWQSIDAYFLSGVNMVSTAEPSRITAASVTGGLFSSLGVAPILGRAILPQDAERGADPVIVVSYGLWQRAFGGDRAILGRGIFINGVKHTVIGVMPKGFGFPLGKTGGLAFGGAGNPDAWSALYIDPNIQMSGHYLHALGRLAAGVTLSQAQAEFDTLIKNKVAVSPGHLLDPKEHTLMAYGLQDDLVQGVRPALRMLFAASCFLLLIACVNIANLLLSRAEARQREIAVRAALGAGTGRLARQFAIEGMFISLLGAVFGLLLAYAAMGLLTFIGDAEIPRADQVGLNLRVVLFAIAVSVSTGVVFGMVPLFHVIKKNLFGAIKTSGNSTTDNAGAQRFRQALVISQIALALVLLTGTGLMLRAFWKMQEVDVGFSSKGVTTFFVSLPNANYPIESAQKLWAAMAERLNAISGVESASLSAGLPPVLTTDAGVGVGIRVEGFVPNSTSAVPTVSTPQGPVATVDQMQIVTPSYFDTLKIRLVSGRFFDSRDGTESPKVAIVNQSMAQAFWGGENPLGRRVRHFITEEWYTVVGVIADVKNNGVDKPAGTEFYLPSAQSPFWMNSINVAVRSDMSSSAVISAVRGVVRGLDPALPLTKIRALDDVVAASQSRSRFLTLLLTSFAGVALTLAAIGIYGVISYSVAQRTREFGIRMALGAQHGAVLGQVLKGGLLLIIGGVVIGLAGAFGLTRFLSGFLFGVTPTDPITFAGVSLLLGIVALLACYIPARRATRIDPLVALRTE